MTHFAFGDHVAIHAFAVRVTSTPAGTFKQAGIDVDGSDLPVVDTWPGAPVPLEWQPPRFLDSPFDLEPEPVGACVARVRRVPLNPPATGIVIGASRKFEGVVRHEGEGRIRETRTRTIPVVEVAVAPRTRSTSRGFQATRAVVISAHANDLLALSKSPERAVTEGGKGPFKGFRT